MNCAELDALLVLGLAEIANSRGEQVYPIVEEAGLLRGVGISPIPPGTTLGPRYEACLSILDDRSGNTRGPDSFDSDFIDWMLRGSSFVAIDSAEPDYDIYNYFMQEVARGRKLLVIQTTEEHHSRWREFLCEHWEGDSIAEIWPVKNDPERILRADVTRFDPDRKKPQ